MERFIFMLEVLALFVLGISSFMKGESHTIAMFIVCILLAISMIYNGMFICDCVRSFFGRKCKTL